MDNEMIERCILAAAIKSDPDRINGRDLVITVIKAMREPTETIKEAVINACHNSIGYYEGCGTTFEGNATEIWQAMIDAIIGDK